MDFDKNDRKKETAQALLEKQYGGARDGEINDASTFAQRVRCMMALDELSGKRGLV